MSDHSIDILLRAKDQASKAIRGVNRELGRTQAIGQKASRGLRVAGVGLAAGAGVVAGGIALAVKTGLQDLATLESAVTSVDGAIKQMGLTGKVTGGQVAGWANEIEAAVGAAFDDKDITAATENLIRYGKVTDRNLRPAMEVMTDLAAKTGSVSGASELLGKSLADPTRAAGKLSRYGIILTKQQQKQIKAMVEAGDVAGAQAKLLDILSVSTKGAAAASQGPYARSLAVLSDVSEDARKALAIGFLPVLEKLADKLSKALGDPAVVKNIESFGRGMAGAVDDLIDFAEKVPWSAIGSGVKTAAEWTGRLFDAFRSMPPEAQATIVALAGLNKLSGGAISGIVGELGKGLIKGVLGMTAGVVNIKAGTVVGGGGAGVPGAGAPAGGGGIGQAIQVVTAGTIALGVGQGMREVSGTIFSKLFPPEVATRLQEISNSVNPLPNIVTTLEGLPSLPGKIADLINGPKLPGSGTGTDFVGGRGGPGGGRTVEAVAKGTKPTKDAVVEAQGKLDSSIQRARDAARQAGTTTAGATRSAGTIIAGNATGNASRVVGAIAANRAVVNTSVRVYVSGSSVTQQQTTTTRSGGSSSSRVADGYNDHGI